MSVVKILMDGAAADTDVLRTLDRHGDDFSIPRDVDFKFRADTKEKAEIVAGFLNDHNFAVAVVQLSNGEHSVNAALYMSVQQNLILSVSGFMGCVAQLFGVGYDGWGCAPQKR
ncbi:ribonuclease E inhibitor RraB [Dyella terrae]|uniref:ribonuclease E inhibitor RraB n=1 Tax=Dyella terrae TaxID=522259 RepID=UPI001EFEE637|nr:ribonuclease E inhibitor RraB [Dyella terrae]ULU25308.1 ribonuclease E inhibitor RraB [Dyella terrae]